VLENHDGWINGIASFEGGIAILDGYAQILMFDATTGGALDVWQPPAGLSLTGGLWCTEGPAPTIP